MISPDTHVARRVPKGWNACLRVLLIAAAGLLASQGAASGTYFMYRDQPLRLMTPKKFAPAPPRIRPFDYRRDYTPSPVFQREGFTKSLPPLDLRVKSTLSFPVDFEGFLLDCESSIRAVMIRNRKSGDHRSGAQWETAPRVETSIGRATGSGEAGAVPRDPLRRPEFRGPVHLAAAGGEMQSAPEDLTFMLGGLARAVSRNTSIEVKVDSLVSLDSPGLRTVPFLLLSFAHEPRLSADEKNHLRRYLRGGGFALVYCELPSGPDALLSRLFPDSRPEEAQAKPVPQNHPLYQSHFDLPDGPVSASAADVPVGVWIKDRLAAVCLPRRSGFSMERAPEDSGQKLWVNLVVFALTQPGGIATAGTEGTAMPR